MSAHGSSHVGSRTDEEPAHAATPRRPPFVLALPDEGEVRENLRVIEEETERLRRWRQFAARPAACRAHQPGGPARARPTCWRPMCRRASRRGSAPPELPLVEGHYDAAARVPQPHPQRGRGAGDDGRRATHRGRTDLHGPRRAPRRRHGRAGSRSSSDTGPGMPPGAEERVFEPDLPRGPAARLGCPSSARSRVPTAAAPPPPEAARVRRPHPRPPSPQPCRHDLGATCARWPNGSHARGAVRLRGRTAPARPPGPPGRSPT